MASERDGRRSAVAFRLVIAGGLLACLAANLPGHLSVDSVIALQEGRTEVRLTWAPAIYSWILGRFDDLLSGVGLYVTASAALFFFSLMTLTGLRPRSTWTAAVLALLVVLTPQVLIYQGIVWRDVLFANLTIAGFIFLAHAARRWDARPLGALAGALACLSLAVLVRQNGIVLAVAAAAVLGWTARGRGLKSGAAWGVGGLLATVLIAATLNAVVQPDRTAPGLRQGAEALILQHYDVVGAAAHDPTLRLSTIGAANPAAQAIIERDGRARYTPARIDTLDQDPTLRRALWRLPDAAMAGQWREVILEHPGAYLKHRADVFRWVFLTPDLQLCLPVQVGVLGPEEMLGELRLAPGMDLQDAALAKHASRFYGTPVYSHLSYALLALGVIAILLLRRDPADWVVMALLAGSLAFAATFFLISVACDYRYLYLLDVAAMVSALYVALDPPKLRRRARHGL